MVEDLYQQYGRLVWQREVIDAQIIQIKKMLAQSPQKPIKAAPQEAKKCRSKNTDKEKES